MRNQAADITWTERIVGTGGVSWRPVASSDDGTRLAACLLDRGSIHTSTDSGGRPLVEHGIRFIYQRPGAPANPAPKPTAGVLRVLEVFSVLTDDKPPTPRKQLRYLHRLSQPFRRKRL